MKRDYGRENEVVKPHRNAVERVCAIEREKEERREWKNEWVSINPTTFQWTSNEGNQHLT